MPGPLSMLDITSHLALFSTFTVPAVLGLVCYTAFCLVYAVAANLIIVLYMTVCVQQTNKCFFLLENHRIRTCIINSCLNKMEAVPLVGCACFASGTEQFTVQLAHCCHSIVCISVKNGCDTLYLSLSLQLSPSLPSPANGSSCVSTQRLSNVSQSGTENTGVVCGQPSA